MIHLVELAAVYAWCVAGACFLVGDARKLVRWWRAIHWFKRRRRPKVPAGYKYADRRYRQHSDGSFSGPYKGCAWGRGHVGVTQPDTEPFDYRRVGL